MQRTSKKPQALTITAHSPKRVYSGAFVVSFVAFVTLDIFYNWMTHNLHWSASVVRSVEGIALVAAIALFTSLMKERLPTEPALTTSRNPLVKQLRTIDDPLLILRCFAFFCVVVTHCYIVFKLETSSSWDFLLKGCAHSGMILFFCLSGYLMGKAFYSGRYRADSVGIRSFYSNRALRVLPLCYFASFIVILFVSPDLLKYESLRQLWRPLLFLYYAGNQPGPIGALWAVSVEVQYYVIAPFIFVVLSPLLSSKARIYGFIAVVLISGLLLKYSLYEMKTDWYTHRYTPLLANLDFFLVGYAINPLVERYKQDIRNSDRYVLEIVVSVFLCLLIYLVASAGEYSKVQYLIHGRGRLLSRSLYVELLSRTVLIMTFLCILCIERYKIKRGYFTDRPPRLLRLLGAWVSRPLQIAGVLTFGLYVWHSSVMTSYSTLMAQRYELTEYLFYCAVGLLLTLLLSLITYFVIERPAENFKV